MPGDQDHIEYWEPLPKSQGSSGALVGLCECGDSFPDVSALMAHKMRHHMLEWPNVADAAKRLRVNLEVQDQGYTTVRSDDLETLLGFAEKEVERTGVATEGAPPTIDHTTNTYES